MAQSPVDSNSYPIEHTGFRFGLADVMIVITAAAIALWSYDWTHVFNMTRTPDAGHWKAIVRSNHIVGQTLSLTGLLLFLQAVVTTRTVFRHPGYWILYCYGFSAAVEIVAGLCLEIPRGGSFADLLGIPIPIEHLVHSINQILNVIGFTYVFALLIYAIAVIGNKGRWRFAFSSLLALIAVNFAIAYTLRFSLIELAGMDPQVTSLVSILSKTTNALTACTAIIFAYCALSDRYVYHRDWKHWLGITLLIHNLYSGQALAFVESVLG